MKRTLKSLVGQTLFASAVDEILLRDAAVVVVFHRVQDGARGDGLTVGVRQFERYCRFFQRHFNVVPLERLVSSLQDGRPLSRELAITFDDGYRDNFENAAPVLEALGLPATFFVVSQWVESDVVPWWDGQAGVRHPWMSWAQVRSLHRRGFEIGAHTRTHVDLGSVTVQEAADEIAGARRELESRLSAPVESFAYPYGGRENVAESSRALVKASGFRCCCSCYGGVVAPGTDPFHLARIPVSSWYKSPHHFGLDVVLGNTLLPR